MGLFVTVVFTTDVPLLSEVGEVVFDTVMVVADTLPFNETVVVLSARAVLFAVVVAKRSITLS